MKGATLIKGLATMALHLCRYLVKVTVTGKGMVPDSRKEASFWVRNYEEPSEAAAPIKVRRAFCGWPLPVAPSSVYSTQNCSQRSALL